MALHVEDAKHPALDLEREGRLGLGLWKGIDVAIVGITAYIAREDFLTGLCHVTDNTLTELDGGGGAGSGSRRESSLGRSNAGPAE
jgi:hypothetical protein